VLAQLRRWWRRAEADPGARGRTSRPSTRCGCCPVATPRGQTPRWWSTSTPLGLRGWVQRVQGRRPARWGGL